MVDNIFNISSIALGSAGDVLEAIFNGVVAVFNAITGVFQ